jgi:hypothetical protein
MNRQNTLILGASLVLGLALLGWLGGEGLVRFKEMDRTVTVKGLSEREVMADIVIWPIQFTAASNDLAALYRTLDAQAAQIRTYLQAEGIEATEITVSAPAITDKSAQQYGGPDGSPFRYTAMQTVTVYSGKVAEVRTIMSGMSELGRQGIVFSGDNYMAQTEYLYTGLNDIKPEMIEEATRSAREVAEKFAMDSASSIGKIQSASQGQFTITLRDNNNPHIKNVRVVSTITYHLAD